MIIVKDDLIGNSWLSMSIFVQSKRSFQRTSVSLFKMATMDLVITWQASADVRNLSRVTEWCKQFGSEVVLMLLFLRNGFVFNTIYLIRQ